MDRRRSALVVVVLGSATLALLAASCAGAAGPASSPSGSAGARLPWPGAVRDGRFVVPVRLDDGRLLVEPPPPGTRPTFPQSQAASEIWASPVMSGSRSGYVLGFGLVTTRVSAPGTPRVRRLPAWVGFAWGRVLFCPMQPASSAPSPTPALPSNGYAAVVVGAKDGVPAFTYTARSSSCGRPPKGPTVAMATTTLSIAWRRVGPRTGPSIVIAFQLPPCGRLVSTSVTGGAAGPTVEVDATTPDVPLPCPAPVTKTTRVNVGEAPTIHHARLGPVRQIQV